MTTRITQDHPPRLPAPHEYARHLERCTKAQPDQADEPMGRLDRALLSVLLFFAAVALLFVVVASYTVADFTVRHREHILDGFIALTVCLTLYFFLT